jgi:hypothetical protein
MPAPLVSMDFISVSLEQDLCCRGYGDRSVPNLSIHVYYDVPQERPYTHHSIFSSIHKLSLCSYTSRHIERTFSVNIISHRIFDYRIGKHNFLWNIHLLYLFLYMALQASVGPRPVFRFLNPIHSR